VSCSTTSIEELERTTTVKPPTVNKKINPNAQSIDGVIVNRTPCKVPNQLKTLIPVGTAIIIVADVKYARVSASMPTVNIWCAHTTNPKIPIHNIAYTMPNTPNTSLLPLSWATICEINPNPGKIRI